MHFPLHKKTNSENKLQTIASILSFPNPKKAHQRELELTDIEFDRYTKQM